MDLRSGLVSENTLMNTKLFLSSQFYHCVMPHLPFQDKANMMLAIENIAYKCINKKQDVDKIQRIQKKITEHLYKRHERLFAHVLHSEHFQRLLASLTVHYKAQHPLVPMLTHIDDTIYDLWNEKKVVSSQDLILMNTCSENISSIHNIKKIEKDVIKTMSTLSNLKKLTCTEMGLGDYAIAALGNSLKNLQYLSILSIGKNGLRGDTFHLLPESITSLFILNSKITCDNLSKLQNKSGLKRLDLRRIASLKEADFSSLPPSLKYLKLSDIGLLDTALLHLGKLKKLKQLDLSYNALITGAALSNLPKDIQTLNLDKNKLVDDVWKHIEEFKNLTALNLKGNKNLTESKLELVSKTVNELQLQGCNFSNAIFEKLALFKKLECLYLGSNPSITGDGIRFLPQSLLSLNLSECSLSDNAMEELSGLKALVELDLSYNNQIQEQWLSKLPASIKKLTFAGCSQFTDDFFTKIKHLQNLTYLDIGEAENITGKGVSLLSQSLSYLGLSGCRGTDESLYELEYLQGLTHVSFSFTKGVSSKIINCLPASIQSLKLFKCVALTDDFFENLYKLPNLKELYMSYNTQITGSSINRLPKTIEVLEIEHCNLSNKAKQELQQRDHFTKLRY